jgi:hypothetical protein
MKKIGNRCVRLAITKKQWRKIKMSNKDKRAIKEFRESGLLWFINTILQVFGWSIYVDLNGDEITGFRPGRNKARGFEEKYNTEGYIKVSEYLKKNIDELLKESKL